MSAHADPVRALLHRHRQLCEQAVDPLEIAAALEAHGVTDRGAARFRHRDVFSLAEELYARVPRAETAARRSGARTGARGDGEHRTPGPAPRRPVAPRRPIRTSAVPRHVLLPLLPGALCAAALTARHLLQAPAAAPAAPRAVALVTWAALAAWAALPLVATWWVLVRDARPRAAVLCAVPLLALVLHGGGLLAELLAVAPASADPALVTALPLACAAAPGVWCSRWFAARARARLSSCRSLTEFAAAVRLLLGTVLVMFTAALLAVQAAAQAVLRLLPGSPPPPPAAAGATTALGVLLFTAVLLVVHGHARAAGAGIAAACGGQLLALSCAGASRLPGLDALGEPLTGLAEAHGTAAVPAVTWGCAAAGLLVHAVRALTSASAHHRAPAPEPG